MPALFRTKKGGFLAIGCLLAVLIVAYLPAFHAPFIWDDEVMVVGNPLIRSIENIPQILQSSAFGAVASSNDFFRPIQTISYILDYHLFGLNASGFHVMSWIYFVCVCGLLWYLLTQLSASGLSLSQKQILAIVFLFAVHPLNIEVVTYISGRGDVLFLLFSLIALCTTLLASQKKTWGIPLAWITASLAILSKENAVALPFVMTIMWLILPKKQRNWRYWVASTPVLIGNILYIGYRLLAMKNPDSSPLSTIAIASLSERILTIPYILWTYFRLIFVPYPLHMEYLTVVTDLVNPYLWLGMPLMIGVLFLLWQWGKHRSTLVRSGSNTDQTTITPTRVYVFFMAWIALGIGPVIQLVPLTSTVREHWFSFSLIAALTLLVICLPPRLLKLSPKYQYTLFGIIMTISIGLTYTRNLDWADPMRLYSHDVFFEPRSFLLHNNIGVLHYRNGAFEKAKYAFQKSVLVTPNGDGYGTALNNLGVIAEQENHRDEALRYYERSIRASQYELAYANALRLLLMDQQWEKAYTLSQNALQKYPYHYDILRYATAINFQLGYAQEADLLSKRLKQLYPQ
jgi:tetratricopeptide (TPR) repeat protein